MYTILENEGAVEIRLNESAVFKSIKPAVQMDDGEAVALSFESQSAANTQSGRNYTFTYADKSQKTHVSISFAVDSRFVTCKLQASRVDKWSEPIRRFDRDYGIQLHMQPLQHKGKMLAIYQHNKFWTMPAFCRDASDIPNETQSLLWLEGANYGFATTASCAAFKSEFLQKDDGMTINITHGGSSYAEAEAVCFVLGLSEEPYDLVEKGIARALQAAEAPANMRRGKPYPEELHYLGWCSWDAFYSEVTEDGVIAKAEEFAKLDLPVKMMILDDGWQHRTDFKLQAFKEDRAKFPSGLQALVSRLKQQYGMTWVGIWHAMLGHWNGIEEGSEYYEDMKDLLRKTKNGRIIPDPHVTKSFTYYTRLHTYLASCGFDFVKVDGQSMMTEYVKADLPIGQAARHIHQALDGSVGLHFDGVMINCMGMAIEQIFSRPASAVSRNSKDFFPKREKDFLQHAISNAYNALTHGQVYWGDWDMFWTNHPHATNNALLRAVSGGPVYVSDPVGTTVADELWPLILRDGRVLKCDRPGMPAADCLLRDPASETLPLKITNTVGSAGVVAVFNVHFAGEAVQGTVSPSDIYELRDEQYAVYDHFSGRVQMMDYNDRINVELPADGYALFSFIPVRDGFAAIGLSNKYISAAAIAEHNSFAGKEKVLLHEGGSFVFVSDAVPKAVYVNGDLCQPEKMDGYFKIDCTQIDGKVWIDIDM